MYNRSKILAVAVLLCLPLGLLALPQGIQNEVNKEPARFVISGWSYPDEYGQGIMAIRPYDNSSGDWVNFGGWIDYYESTILEFNVSSALKLKVLSTFNATLTGASSLVEGKNLLRHSVNVTITNGTNIFSQQNFTYLDSGDEETGIYDYEYEVILDFISVMGEIYTVTITYEIYYPEVEE